MSQGRILTRTRFLGKRELSLSVLWGVDIVSKLPTRLT